MGQRNPLTNPKMKQGLFTNLPSEITLDIMSRLPVRSVICCKCVCKPWLHLLETDEFAKSHLSKSVPGLAVNGPVWCRKFEFEDVPNLNHHELHYNPVTKFRSTYYGVIRGSASGLLFFLHNFIYGDPCGLYILNPITREFIQIPRPYKLGYGNIQESTYGFGTDRISGQHKLVRIYRDCICDCVCTSDEETEELRSPSFDCQVYTIGTGVWRSITPGPMLEYEPSSFGAYLNGNLHWLVFDLNDCPSVSCLDLEDELFSTFPSPPALVCQHSDRMLMGLFALEDCLCLSDCVSDGEIVIWLMKDYGVEKSWVKEFVISKEQILAFSFADDEIAYPIKVFKDGDILMTWGGVYLFYYSTKTETTHEIFSLEASKESTLHTSSFVSLKSFEGKESVYSF